MQFKNQNLAADRPRARSPHSGLPAQRLELEITESVLLQNNEATLATLHRLRELGVRIAMDDFGTGYSSLSYLRSFPFDKIKIDRSFINDIADKDEFGAIVQAVTSLGQPPQHGDHRGRRRDRSPAADHRAPRLHRDAGLSLQPAGAGRPAGRAPVDGPQAGATAPPRMRPPPRAVGAEQIPQARESAA